jgi:cold shock CspA family protein
VSADTHYKCIVECRSNDMRGSFSVGTITEWHGNAGLIASNGREVFVFLSDIIGLPREGATVRFEEVTRRRGGALAVNVKVIN